jgi:hypothetical protein
VANVAAGRPVELVAAEDRTDRGGGLALDILALATGRLEGRVARAQAGARLRITPVLTEGTGRLVLSARVVEEPGGLLIDILSASVETAGEALTLIAARPPTSAEVDIAGFGRTPPVDGPILDLAWTRDDELAVLGGDALALYHLEANTLSLTARQPVPVRAPVRAPAGVLLPAVGDASLWVLSNRAGGAVLFARDSGRLWARAEAEALPWPGSRAGLRYRPGTNLLEGSLPGIGDGPFLHVAPGALAAVGPGGRLLLPGASTERAPLVGPCLAPLWSPLLAGASADPPGATDRLLLVDTRTGQVAEGMRVDGAIRSLASRPTPQGARVALGVVEPDGVSRLVVVELRRREP